MMTMLKYAFNPRKEKSARVYGRSIRISGKSSALLCSNITGKSLLRGRRLLNDLITQRRSIHRKYYTNAARQILDLLGSVQANAEAKGLDPEKLSSHASAHQGFTFWRNRRFKVRRQKRKVCSLQIVLMQR